MPKDGKCSSVSGAITWGKLLVALVPYRSLDLFFSGHQKVLSAQWIHPASPGVQAQIWDI